MRGVVLVCDEFVDRSVVWEGGGIDINSQRARQAGRHARPRAYREARDAPCGEGFDGAGAQAVHADAVGPL